MAGAGHPRAKIALQLYTLRELTAAGMAPALQAVAGIGFTGVELAGLTDLSAAETAEELRVLGTENVVFPWLPTPSSIVELEAACDRVAQATVRAASLGLAPHFHNHWGEFDRVSTGERLWDCLTAIHGLGLELDLGWAWSAGEQPEELLRANAGRCRLVHLKDLRRSGDEVSDTPLGDGDLDWPSIVPVALEVGAEWLIVEQDHPGEQPLAAVERSFTYLAEIL